MRKLPVFLVIDVSESVAGPLQQSITQGMKSIVSGLRSDPQALESVHMSVIVFAGKAKVLVNMVELANFLSAQFAHWRWHLTQCSTEHTDG